MFVCVNVRKNHAGLTENYNVGLFYYTIVIYYSNDKESLYQSSSRNEHEYCINWLPRTSQTSLKVKWYLYTHQSPFTVQTPDVYMHQRIRLNRWHLSRTRSGQQSAHQKQIGYNYVMRSTPLRAQTHF